MNNESRLEQVLRKKREREADAAKARKVPRMSVELIEHVCGLLQDRDPKKWGFKSTDLCECYDARLVGRTLSAIERGTIENHPKIDPERADELTDGIDLSSEQMSHRKQWKLE